MLSIGEYILPFVISKWILYKVISSVVSRSAQFRWRSPQHFSQYSFNIFPKKFRKWRKDKSDTLQLNGAVVVLLHCVCVLCHLLYLTQKPYCSATKAIARQAGMPKLESCMFSVFVCDRACARWRVCNLWAQSRNLEGVQLSTAIAPNSIFTVSMSVGRFGWRAHIYLQTQVRIFRWARWSRSNASSLLSLRRDSIYSVPHKRAVEADDKPNSCLTRTQLAC